jgi:hypothetical protein
MKAETLVAMKAETWVAMKADTKVAMKVETLAEMKADQKVDGLVYSWAESWVSVRVAETVRAAPRHLPSDLRKRTARTRCSLPSSQYRCPCFL